MKVKLDDDTALDQLSIGTFTPASPDIVAVTLGRAASRSTNG